MIKQPINVHTKLSLYLYFTHSQEQKFPKCFPYLWWSQKDEFALFYYCSNINLLFYVFIVIKLYTMFTVRPLILYRAQSSHQRLLYNKVISALIMVTIRIFNPLSNHWVVLHSILVINSNFKRLINLIVY